jgi:hypothetical protein
MREDLCLSLLEPLDLEKETELTRDQKEQKERERAKWVAEPTSDI